MTRYARAVGAIVYKDILVELRARETVVAALVFALLAVVIFAFALDLAPATARAIAPGLLWVTLAFAGVLTFGRLFGVEQDRHTLDGLLLAPADPTALYMGKLLAAFLFLLATLAVLLPAFAVLLGVSLLSPAVAAVTVLGLAGLAAAGTLFGALALNGRAREVLLPVLFLPLAVPIVIVAAGATDTAVAGTSLPGGALGTLVAADALYITAGALLFPYTIEE